MALSLHTRKRGREGATSNTARIGARTVMVDREVLINEFDELCWQQTNLIDVFLSRGWGNVCTLRGKVYPSMVQEFYMGMCDMPPDASSHTVTVRGVSLRYHQMSSGFVEELSHLHMLHPMRHFYIIYWPPI